MRLKASSPDRSNWPVVSSERHSAPTRSLSRISRSKMKRSKLDALEMSIDGLLVWGVSAVLRAR